MMEFTHRNGTKNAKPFIFSSEFLRELCVFAVKTVFFEVPIMRMISMSKLNSDIIVY
jgi:hypothetical protein